MYVSVCVVCVSVSVSMSVYLCVSVRGSVSVCVSVCVSEGEVVVRMKDIRASGPFLFQFTFCLFLIF